MTNKRPAYTAHSLKLDEAILAVLPVGADKALTRDIIIARVSIYGQHPTERQFRAAIHDMRQAGQLICSSAGENPGYYKPATLNDVLDFVQSEIEPRITDLAKTKVRLLAAARAAFGDAVQERLI
ncbi:MAG TPA: hypothetical protein PLA25_12535 [Anaerolineaceae bacterium]|nr:hypothetical protein [Anaerolineaceae bacterium]